MTASRNLNVRWSPGKLRRLARYIHSGLNYRECALLLATSYGSIIGAVHRHNLSYTPEQALERRQQANYERGGGGRAPQWNKAKDERQFIEPWAKFHARKVAERAAQKERAEALAAALQVTSADQEPAERVC